MEQLAEDVYLLAGFPRYAINVHSFFSRDPAQNRRSARRLVELEPKLICFGHGPPMREIDRFMGFVGQLADS